MKFISFTQWVEAMGNPSVLQNPNLKMAAANGIKAAKLAIDKKKNPIKAAQNAILIQAQTGKVNTKDLAKIMPNDEEEGI